MLHGGKTPVGSANPSFKHGRYSKYLPTRLLERYHESQSDPELLNLSAEISLVDARLAELLKRVDTGEAKDHWTQASKLIKDVRAAGSDRVLVQQLIGELGETIKEAQQDYSVWDEINRQMDQRRRLVESERKRLVEMQQFISQEKAIVLVTALLDAIKRHVTDRKALTAVSNELVRILGSPSSAEPSRGAGDLDSAV